MIPIKLGISSKISILVCSIAVLSVVLTSGWAFYSFRQLLIEENLENIEHDAHVASDRLRSRIEDMSNDVKFLHDIPPISGLIRASTNSDGIDIEDTSSEVQWKNRLAVIFKELINAKPYYRRIRFIGVADKGREIVRVDRVVPENRIVRIPDDQLQTKEHRDFYQAIIKTADKQVYLSEMNLNWDHGKIIVPHVPVIRAAMRVEDEQGKIFGFVLINMDLSYVFKELKESLHSQTKFLMTNTNGDFLVHPDPLKTFGFDLGRPSLILEEYPTLKGQFNDVGLEHWSGMIEQDSAKSPTMAASMHKIYFDPTKPDRFICLLLTIPKDKIVASLEAVQRQILYVMIGLFLIAMVIGLFFSRSLTRPLLQIIESIDSYGKGDTHSIHVHKAPSDETGILLHAFQHMVFQVEKRANELRFSEARNRAVLDAAADAILSINENGIIQSVNEATETLFGYTSDEMIGQQIEKLMPSPHREMHQSYLERHRNPEMNHPAPSEGVIGRIREISGLRKNGSVFPMELSVSRVWINQSQLFTGIIRDVSERKEAEARLIAKNIELEQKNKEAEQFIYSVSHDLKAPILSCTGLMALLWEDMDRNDLDAVRDSLKRIDRNVLRLENCVGDLLEFCRVGSIPHEPVLVDVNKILKQVVTELELSINQADATLDIEQDMPSVIADPNRMTELFINLLNNAITYGCKDAANRTIHVGGKVENGQVQYFVKDHGNGIGEAYHEKIFSLFQRLNNDRQGSGVGLAIVSRIMELHNGKVWVESQPGQGATFWVAFPMQPQSDVVV